MHIKEDKNIDFIYPLTIIREYTYSMYPCSQFSLINIRMYISGIMILLYIIYSLTCFPLYLFSLVLNLHLAKLIRLEF